MVSRTMLAATTLTLALLAWTPSADAHVVHCDTDGNHALWLGAYLNHFDPNDPDTWSSGIAEVGAGCCTYNGDVIDCTLWKPLQ